METKYLHIHDSRIESDNYLFQITIGDYYDLMKTSLFENIYQRKRVQNSKSIYALLKSDITMGCVMPPIVLALDSNLNENKDILVQLKEAEKKPIILDGLQRSLSICDLLQEEPENRDLIRSRPIRIELYTNLSRIWLLYRMLTLNTGQTQMSTRHQIEIIYSDYKDNCNVPGVTLIPQVANDSPTELGEYNFRDIIDGFTSYVQMDYLRIDRLDILENVKDLKRLAGMNSDSDLFNSFLDAYNSMVLFLNQNISKNDLDSIIDSIKFSKDPFGNTIAKMFNKSQTLTGFGAAIAKLRQLGDITDFSELKNLVQHIDIDSIYPGIYTILKDLDKIRQLAKKIGNDQRFYFYHLFRSLFSRDNEDHSLEYAAQKAYGQYEREVL